MYIGLGRFAWRLDTGREDRRWIGLADYLHYTLVDFRYRLKYVLERGGLQQQFVTCALILCFKSLSQ